MTEKKHFNGGAAECLAHYAERCTPRERAEELLVRFTGASLEGSVERWLDGKYLPVGEYLIKLCYFLEAGGYGVRELESLTPAVREFGRLIGYGLLTAKEAARELGYAHVDSVHELFHGLVARPTGARAEKMRTITMARQAQLAAREQEFRASLAGATAPAAARQAEALPVAAAEDHSMEITVFAHLTRAMMPLAERILSDAYRAEERRELRRLADGDGVFRLANLLNRLCTEKAREVIPAYQYRTNDALREVPGASSKDQAERSDR